MNIVRKVYIQSVCNEMQMFLQSDIRDPTFKICVPGKIITRSLDIRDPTLKKTKPRNDQSCYHYLCLQSYTTLLNSIHSHIPLYSPLQTVRFTFPLRLAGPSASKERKKEKEREKWKLNQLMLIKSDLNRSPKIFTKCPH